jgi:cyclic-di-GMP phosphodiesterase TipF (flagellum assembly factor)
MRSLGFRFALSAMTDLDMDFEALAEQGFVFVKLDASVFLQGLPAPSGRIPANDVCRHLAQHGLTLVVDHIEDDDQLARVFGFGVLLGQGQLFGGARPVRADVVTARARTVAAE